MTIDSQSAKEIEEILRRRANEIAGFHSEYTRASVHLGSVELALSREIERLRDLADRIAPQEDEDSQPN